MSKPGTAQGQLYNIAIDPFETHNVYLERPEQVARMSKVLDKIRSTRQYADVVID
ncbi:MAG: hypothetical protein SGI77_08130 [Pirellulaceae bacterium]|nr:hypothetical protein [Pirellulaceae bacterium]